MGPDDTSGSGSIRSSASSAGSHLPIFGSHQSGAQVTIKKIEHVTSSIVKLKDQLDDTNLFKWAIKWHIQVSFYSA